MNDTVALSRYKLDTFLTCQRRFQLRYLERLPWPEMPLAPDTIQSRQRGEQFHRVLEQSFLGFPVDENLIGDEQVLGWWRQFAQSGLKMPNGRRRPELSLTIPVGNQVLVGRFDLVILGEEQGQPFVHLFDWKTSKPLSVSELKAEWQTRLYFAMLAESGSALGTSVSPEQIHLTYWYVREPHAPRTLSYDSAWHAQNWAEIKALVADIEAHLQSGQWPLTEQWSHCQACRYQLYCGRQPEPASVSVEPEGFWAEEAEPEAPPWDLELLF